MAFNNEIRILTTEDTNHADNFNEPLQELLENTQFNAKQIDVLSEDCIYLNGAINLDVVIKKGEYFINSTTELVDGTGVMNAYLKVYVSNVTGHLVQKIIRHNQNDGFYIAYRQQVGTWQDWIKLSTSDEITDLQEKSIQYRGVISDNDSVANYTSKDKVGEWYVTSGIGTPSGYAYGYLTVYYNPNQNYIKHTFRDVYTNASFENSLVNGSWVGWSKIATTEKIDISSKLVGGWKVLDDNCTLEANIVGGVLFVNGLIKNDGTSVVCLDLSQYPPLIKKWHGGLAIGSNGINKWFVIDPYGSVQFQGGHELGLAYSISFNYRIY